jgi:hypothetical protein
MVITGVDERSPPPQYYGHYHRLSPYITEQEVFHSHTVKLKLFLCMLHFGYDYRYKQYIVKHNSINDFIKVYFLQHFLNK